MVWKIIGKIFICLIWAIFFVLIFGWMIIGGGMKLFIFTIGMLITAGMMMEKTGGTNSFRDFIAFVFSIIIWPITLGFLLGELLGKNEIR